MKTLLTPSLLGFLIERGFTYCLSKTLVKTDGQFSEIILTPIKAKPEPGYLSSAYDACYDITREPITMAAGIDQTKIYISTDLPGDDKKPGALNDNSLVFIP